MLNLNENISRRCLFLTASLAVVFSVLHVNLGVYRRFKDTSFDCLEWFNCGGSFYVSDEGLIGALKYYVSVVGWIDLTHEISYIILVLLVVFLAVCSWLFLKNQKYPFRLPIFVLFLVFWQSILSGWSDYIVFWPQIALLDFLMGITTCSLLWILAIRIEDKQWLASKKIIDSFDKIKPWVTLAIIITLIEITLGGWTSVKFASFACPDFPFCQSSWWPNMDLKEGFNFVKPSSLEVLESEARVAINVVHRLGALVSMCYLLGLAIFLLTVFDHRVQRIGINLIAVLIVQMVLLTYAGYIRDPVILTMVHSLGSLMLLLILVGLASRMAYAK